MADPNNADMAANMAKLALNVNASEFVPSWGAPAPAAPAENHTGKTTSGKGT